MPSGSYPVKENPYLHLLARESGQRHTGLRRRESKASGIMIPHLPSANGGWAGRGQGNFLSLGWELSLKVDEPEVGQQHEDEERKCEYYHIIFPEFLCSMKTKIVTIC